MVSRKIFYAVVTVYLLIIMFFALYPLLIMVMGSFKSAAELRANAAGVPIAFTLENYFALLSFSGGIVVRSYLNSLFISTTHTLLVIILSSMAAYAFEKYRFKGSNLVFAALIATMMIPTEMNIPPLYIMFSKIGWLSSYQVQILPGIANVFAMFMFRQYMKSVPDSLVEAARIDGCGHFRAFRSIVFPICAPVTGALCIMVFLSKWNDYLWPIMLVNKKEFLPIMAVLPTLNTSDNAFTIPWEIVLTGCVIVTLPLILLFLLFQDKFMSSVTIGAVKE
jgi:ABC-type glycerol-3-phosphate transport system permease component